MKKVFVFDANKCSGCLCCQISCKDEHCDNDWSPYAKPQPDTGQFWIKIKDTVRGQVPKVMISYVAHMCQHCDNPACEKVCDQGAFQRREDGLLLLDPAVCTGCFACVEACPYDAIYANEDLAIAQKCTGCAHLLDNGWEVPRCVDSCSHEAIRFIDESELTSPESQFESLIPDNDHSPRVHYINLPKRFIGGVVVDLEADEVLIGAKLTLEDVATGEVRVSRTDEFGDFWLRQIDASQYRLYIEHESYMTRMLEVSTVEKDINVGPIALYEEVSA